MTYYAQLDPSTFQVTHWYDTSLNYTNLPDNLITVSDNDWQQHFSNPSGYCYIDYVLTEYVAPVPTLSLQQQAQRAIYAGLNIVSNSNVSLNALYSVDPTAQQNVQAISQYILVNNKFPGSSNAIIWLDANAGSHSFTSVAEFQEFATAVANYVADLTMIILTNSGTLPDNTMTIG